MSARVTLAVDDHGRLLAAKWALHAADAARLAREAEVIRSIQLPGIVALHELRSSTDGVALLTRWVGTRSVADLAHVEPARAGAICASVADTLSEMHERGWVHGRIEASHVLLGAVDPSGATPAGEAPDEGPAHPGDEQPERPVLCSLADAGPAGEPPSGSDEPRRPSDDIQRLGLLLASLLELPAPPGASRWGVVARRRAEQRVALARLAKRAAAPDRTNRPGARALAAALRFAMDGAKVDRAQEHSSDVATHLESAARPRHSARPVRRAVAAGALGIVSLVATVGAVGAMADGGDRDSPHADASGALGARVAPSSNAPDSTLPTASTSSGDIPDDGSGPPIVTVQGRRYEVGEPGDGAVVADWRCKGEPSVAVVRPSTGAVFLFELPLPAAQHATAGPIARVRPGSRLAVPPADHLCPILEVSSPTGSRTVVAFDADEAKP